MTPEQKAAYIFSQAACMLARLEAMKQENAECAVRNIIVYDHTQFDLLPQEFGLTSNQVIAFMRD